MLEADLSVVHPGRAQHGKAVAALKSLAVPLQHKTQHVGTSRSVCPKARICPKGCALGGLALSK